MPVEPLLFFFMWVGVGLIAGVLSRSRTEPLRYRIAASAALGPLAIPLAFRTPRSPARRRGWKRVSAGERDSGRVDVLIGVDEVEALPSLLDATVDLWGEDMGRCGIAVPTRDAADALSRGDALNSVLSLRTAPPYMPLKPETLLLNGDPARMLAHCARDNGYNLVVVPGAPSESFDPPRLASYLRGAPVSLFVLAGDHQIVLSPRG